MRSTWTPVSGRSFACCRPLYRQRDDGQRSIRINDQYRVCFRWEAGDAEDVEIVDYH